MSKRYSTLCLFLTCIFLLGSLNAVAVEVWSGPAMEFNKSDYGDWTQESQQDRITDNVWITRRDYEGLINYAQEDGYNYENSPVGTEWAWGFAEDWMDLDFVPWADWTDWCPPCYLGDNAVLHLIAEDIYIDIIVTEWTIGEYYDANDDHGQGGGQDHQGDLGEREGGGGFSYIRATPPTSPTEGSTLSLVKSLY